MPPSTVVDCAPERVFAVLADAGRYADFVVGSRFIRDAEPGWPDVGSTFHHSLGWGFTLIRDLTTVVESEPPRRLVLHTGMGPLGAARTEFRLEPLGGRTRIEVEEVPSEGLVARPGIAPLVTGLIWLRNKETLRRLGKYSL